MSDRFVTSSNALHHDSPWGPHEWLSHPEVTGSDGLLLVRVTMPVGTGHAFHRHPEMEEIIYIVSGQAEQWVDQERRLLEAGASAFIPTGMVHATYNVGEVPLVFLAILTPARATGPITVDVATEAPWDTLRPTPA